MNEYKIEFSYKSDNGNRAYEEDALMASTTQEAVDRVRGWYADLVDFRVEQVWVDRNNRWELTEAWA